MDTTLFVPTIDVRERIQADVIRLLTRRIVDRFHPQKIILFGSYAYGEPKPESDIDLLVIMDTTLRPAQQALHIRQHLSPLFGLDILVYTPARLAQRVQWGDSFLNEILTRGVFAYESPGT